MATDISPEAEAFFKSVEEKNEAIEKDRHENPHLALISDHLWWLALLAKISVVVMVIGILEVITRHGWI